jgi:hypothetical protein
MVTNPFPRSLQLLTRLLFVTVILVVLANVAGAYTIVFRSGHRIEVPATFEVTTRTVTYELAPGINKTLQLAMIDIVATERANLETPGSFFKHSPQPAIASPAPPIQRAGRTLTNLDLEAIRQRRIESEKGYEKRRIELGLPTIEESRRQQAAGEEALLALARQHAAEDARNEAYWRDRASALRSDFSAVDAQIDYLRSRPVQNQGQIYNYGYPDIYGYPNNGSYPNVYGYPNNGSSPNVYSYPRGRRYPSPYERHRSRNQGTVGASRAGAPNLGVFNTGSGPLRRQIPTQRRLGLGVQLVAPYTPPYQPFVYGNPNNQNNQDDRLDSLLMRRAELETFWRTLEDEARKAKVPQAWLLP